MISNTSLYPDTGPLEHDFDKPAVIARAIPNPVSGYLIRP